MLDDLFERSKHNRHSDHYGHDRHPAGYGDERYGHYNPLLNLAQKLLRNKAILAGIVLTILIIGAVGIWLIVTLLPYLGQVISIVGKARDQRYPGDNHALIAENLGRCRKVVPKSCVILLPETTGQTLRKGEVGLFPLLTLNFDIIYKEIEWIYC